MSKREIPLTVLGGYLGAGKTTLLNRVLTAPHGRSVAVIVNDFGSIPIDVERLRAALGSDSADGIVSLANGCVCCTIGDDLGETLRLLVERPGSRPLEHVVIEASGVANPAAVAAWSTIAPFAVGGVIVLAAADAVRSLADDRDVGVEVRRQIAAADVVVMTKTDLVDAPETAAVVDWCGALAPAAPILDSNELDDGRLVDVLLGDHRRPGSERPSGDESDHEHQQQLAAYHRVEWTGSHVSRDELTDYLDVHQAAILRVKGQILDPQHGWIEIDVVGSNRSLRRRRKVPIEGSGRTSAVVVIARSEIPAPTWT